MHDARGPTPSSTRTAREAQFRALSLIAQSRELAARARSTSGLGISAHTAQRLVDRERAATEAAMAAERVRLALARLDEERRAEEERAWFRAETLRMLADGWTRAELGDAGFTPDFRCWVGIDP